MYIVCNHKNHLSDAILVSTLNMPFFYRRYLIFYKLTACWVYSLELNLQIICICLLTWHYDKPSVAQKYPCLDISMVPKTLEQLKFSYIMANHHENTPIQIYWEFYHQKNENFQMKYSSSFHISAQNIDCGTR